MNQMDDINIYDKDLKSPLNTKNKDNDVDENIVHQIESNSILRKLRIEKLNQNKIDNAPA